MYVMYLDRCRQGPNPVKSPLTHLLFKTAFYEVLLEGWRRPHEINNNALVHRLSIHMPSHTTLKRQCVVCKVHIAISVASNLCAGRKAVMKHTTKT
jgi:hypothetical protein